MLHSIRFSVVIGTVGIHYFAFIPSSLGLCIWTRRCTVRCTKACAVHTRSACLISHILTPAAAFVSSLLRKQVPAEHERCSTHVAPPEGTSSKRDAHKRAGDYRRDGCAVNTRSRHTDRLTKRLQHQAAAPRFVAALIRSSLGLNRKKLQQIRLLDCCVNVRCTTNTKSKI
jgi:hypothetical protein